MGDIAAGSLVAARREHRTVARLPEACRPADLAAGYALQDRIVAALGIVGGWKIGAGDADETPLYAPILAHEIHPSGATLAAVDFPGALIEAEIAFRVQRDLPRRVDLYDLATVAAAVDVLPALEIYRSRYREADVVSPAENLADCLANAGLVVGEPASWPGHDADLSWDIDLVIDGERHEGRRLRHPVGDPLRLVVWLANELVARGDMLRAGQVITTGALVLGRLGRDVGGDWQGLGAVSVRFT
jgi:2-keto-4-pentenoate hydratase